MPDKRKRNLLDLFLFLFFNISIGLKSRNKVKADVSGSPDTSSIQAEQYLPFEFIVLSPMSTHPAYNTASVLVTFPPAVSESLTEQLRGGEGRLLWAV